MTNKIQYFVADKTNESNIFIARVDVFVHVNEPRHLLKNYMSTYWKK